jgi:hypothetical protein
MKRTAVASLLFLGIGLIGGYFLAGSTKYAQVSVSPPEKDFGNVLSGESGEAEFTFTNCGSRPVHFDRIMSSCSCVVISFRPRELDPGESFTIRAQANFNSRGERSERIEAITYPVAARPVRAEIRYHAERSLELERTVFTIGEVRLIDGRWPRELNIYATHCPRPATLALGLRKPSVFMQYELDSSRFDAGEDWIVVRLSTVVPPTFGFFQDHLELQATFQGRTVTSPITITGTLYDDRADFPGISP